MKLLSIVLAVAVGVVGVVGVTRNDEVMEVVEERVQQARLRHTYYVEDGRIYAPDGTEQRFKGVNRPGLEFWCAPDEGWVEGIEEKDFEEMAVWGMNVVLLPLNQECWLTKETYRDFVAEVVEWIHKNEMAVILDLHWLDMERDLAPMPDKQSVVFWEEVASVYGNDPEVLFSVYSEPYDIGAEVWLNGGHITGMGENGLAYDYTAVGIPTLVEAIRFTGAENVILVGGLDYAFDYSDLVSRNGFPLEDENVVYAAHPYGMYDTKDEVDEWNQAFGFLQTDYNLPVMITEFGDSGEVGSGHCGGVFEKKVLDYADEYGMGALIWGWYYSPDYSPCMEVSVVRDYDAYIKTAAGEVFWEWLQQD